MRKKILGEKIDELRINKGYTLEQLAALLDINYTSLSSITRGKSTPKALTLIKLSVVLDYPLYDLMYDLESEDVYLIWKKIIKEIDAAIDNLDLISLSENMKSYEILNLKHDLSYFIEDYNTYLLFYKSIYMNLMYKDKSAAINYLHDVLKFFESKSSVKDKNYIYNRTLTVLGKFLTLIGDVSAIKYLIECDNNNHRYNEIEQSNYANLGLYFESISEYRKAMKYSNYGIENFYKSLEKRSLHLLYANLAMQKYMLNLDYQDDLIKCLNLCRYWNLPNLYKAYKSYFNDNLSVDLPKHSSIDQ